MASFTYKLFDDAVADLLNMQTRLESPGTIMQILGK